MPIKFFQKALLDNGKLQNIDKIKSGDSVLSISFKNGFAEQSYVSVEKEHAIFPKRSWNGFKISWSGGFFFGTENQTVLLSNHEAVALKNLEAEKHELLDKNFHAHTIKKVEFGKVLCGRKTIYLKGSSTSSDDHFLNISGIWVGDAFIEEQQKSANKGRISNAYIFPANPVIRGMRLLMMATMGEKEEN